MTPVGVFFICQNEDKCHFVNSTNLLVDQVVRAALFLGKIGAQGILCVHFGVFDLAGYLTAIQAQIQLFKRCNGGFLGFLNIKRARIDHICPAILQPQECYAVFLPVILILDKVDACVDLRGGIDLTVLAYPVDVDAVGLIFFRNRQGILNFLLSDRVLKRQQDIRRFVRIGVYRDLLRVSAAAGLRIRRVRSQHDSKLLPVLQRDGLHHRLNALTAPVPFREFCDQRPLDAPALLVAEVGLEDLRNEHPHAHAEQTILRLSHRAEVGIDIIKRLLHTLADADAANASRGLSADDQLNIRLRQLCPSEAGDKEITGDLQDALHLAVGADAEIQFVLVLIHAAEGPQLDGGFQNDHIKLCTRQIELERLRAGKVDARVGFISIFPLLPVELEGVAKAIDDG